MNEKKPWKTLETQELMKTGFFRLRLDRCEMNDGKIVPKYYVFEIPDWVQVVPVTPENKLVLVKQYRHASGEFSLELPGGTTSLTSKEDPVKAAERELSEETGYSSSNYRLIGRHRPNPALQNNFVHSYIALNCKKTSDQNLDPYEEIDIVEASIPEVIDLVLKGKITHSLMVATLFMALPHLGFNLSSK